MTTESSMRVVIAVTHSCRVHALWQAAMQHPKRTHAEFVALFVSDDRWQRAARLPFTQEISRVGGSVADFTPQRAEQVAQDAIESAKHQLHKLAADADVALSFEVLPAMNEQLIDELMASAPNLLIAPSVIATEPIYSRLKQLSCEIALIDDRQE